MSLVCHAVLSLQDLGVPSWLALAGVGQQPRQEIRLRAPTSVKALCLLLRVSGEGLHHRAVQQGSAEPAWEFRRLLSCRAQSPFFLHFTLFCTRLMTMTVTVIMNSNYDEAFHSSSPVPGALLSALHIAKELILPTTNKVNALLSPFYAGGNRNTQKLTYSRSDSW